MTDCCTGLDKGLWLGRLCIGALEPEDITQAAMHAFSHSTWIFIVSLVAAAWLRLGRHTQRLRDVYVRSLAGETLAWSLRHLSAALSL